MNPGKRQISVPGGGSTLTHQHSCQSSLLHFGSVFSPAQNSANLFEKLSETRRVARLAAKARMHVELGEFLDGRGKLRRANGCGKFQRGLRFCAHQTAPRQDAQ